MEVVPLVLPAWHRDTLHAPLCSAVGRVQSSANMILVSAHVSPVIEAPVKSCYKPLWAPSCVRAHCTRTMVSSPPTPAPGIGGHTGDSAATTPPKSLELIDKTNPIAATITGYQ